MRRIWGEGLLSHTTHREPERTIVVAGRVDEATAEVEVVRVASIVHGRGPVVAGAPRVERAIVVIGEASVSKVERSTA